MSKENQPETIADWQRAARSVAQSKGFGLGETDVFKHLVLIHSEVSEAAEVARSPNFNPLSEWNSIAGKPEGLPSELADVVIRTCHLAEALGIDLQAAMIRKHEFNKLRPFRHGGKRA